MIKNRINDLKLILINIKVFIIKYRLLSAIGFGFVSVNALIRDNRNDIREIRDNTTILYTRGIEDKQSKIIDSFRLESYTQKKMLQAFIIDRITNNEDLENFELAVWKKVEVGGVFVTTYVNKAYEREFLAITGKSRFTLMGNTTYIVFPKKYFDQYQTNDRITKYSEGLKYFEEDTWNKGKPEGLISVVKWMEKNTNNGEIIIWGVCLKRLK